MTNNKNLDPKQLAVTALNWQLTLVAMTSRDGQRRLKQVYQRLLERAEPINDAPNELTSAFCEKLPQLIDKEVKD